MRPRVRTFGDAAVIVEVEPAARHDVAAALARMAIPGVGDIVPAERSVLVRVDPRGDVDDLARRLAVTVDDLTEPALEREGDELVLPIVYDGADLAAVAELVGLSVPEVIARHEGARYVVAFLGFTPGFAYLDGLPDSLRVPRLATPRKQVPVGAVGIADGRSCVYPTATPGGWRLIGHTMAALFDPAAVPPTPPTPLAAGRRVRFVAS